MPTLSWYVLSQREGKVESLLDGEWRRERVPSLCSPKQMRAIKDDNSRGKTQLTLQHGISFEKSCVERGRAYSR
jgi:hypothetical protein